MAIRTLTQKIDHALENHLAGLIRGEELKYSEIEHWITLLHMAEEHRAPVKRARFFGFTFIRKVSDIREAIDHLAYRA